MAKHGKNYKDSSKGFDHEMLFDPPDKSPTHAASLGVFAAIFI